MEGQEEQTRRRFLTPEQLSEIKRAFSSVNRITVLSFAVIVASFLLVTSVLGKRISLNKYAYNPADKYQCELTASVCDSRVCTRDDLHFDYSINNGYTFCGKDRRCICENGVAKIHSKQKWCESGKTVYCGGFPGCPLLFDSSNSENCPGGGDVSCTKYDQCFSKVTCEWPASSYCDNGSCQCLSVARQQEIAKTKPGWAVCGDTSPQSRCIPGPCPVGWQDCGLNYARTDTDGSCEKIVQGEICRCAGCENTYYVWRYCKKSGTQVTPPVPPTSTPTPTPTPTPVAPSCGGITFRRGGLGLESTTREVLVYSGDVINISADNRGGYGFMKLAQVSSVGDSIPASVTNFSAEGYDINYTFRAPELSVFSANNEEIYAVEVNTFDSKNCRYLCSPGKVWYEDTNNMGNTGCKISGHWRFLGSCQSNCRKWLKVVRRPPGTPTPTLTPTTTPTLPRNSPTPTPTATPTPPRDSCSTELDVMLIIDDSISIARDIRDQRKRQMVHSFIQKLVNKLGVGLGGDTRVAVVHFSSVAKLAQRFTEVRSDIGKAVSAFLGRDVDKRINNGSTCVSCGLFKARKNIVNDGRRKIAIVLTDGIHNTEFKVNGDTEAVDTTTGDPLKGLSCDEEQGLLTPPDGCDTYNQFPQTGTCGSFCTDKFLKYINGGEGSGSGSVSQLLFQANKLKGVTDKVIAVAVGSTNDRIWNTQLAMIGDEVIGVNDFDSLENYVDNVITAMCPSQSLPSYPEVALPSLTTSCQTTCYKDLAQCRTKGCGNCLIAPTPGASFNGASEVMCFKSYPYACCGQTVVATPRPTYVPPPVSWWSRLPFFNIFFR